MEDFLQIEDEVVTYQGKIIALIEEGFATLFVEQEDLDDQGLSADAQESLQAHLTKIKAQLASQGLQVRHEPWPGRRGL